MPELLRELRAEATAELRRLRAPALRAQPGPWLAPQRRFGCHFGLLVTEGILLRSVSFSGRSGAELLGRGDLIQPWARQPPVDTVMATTRWRALEPIELAVLDSKFVHCVARWPQVAAALIERGVERSGMLAFQQVATHVPGLEGRLVAMLWALADRWGRVTPAGVLVPIRLTHATLAALVGASRPSVSSSLKLLERRGTLERQGDGWLLHGEPPVDSGHGEPPAESPARTAVRRAA